MISGIGLVGRGPAGGRLVELAAARGLHVADPSDGEVDVVIEAVDGPPAARVAALAQYRGTARLLITTSWTRSVEELSPPGAGHRTLGLRAGLGPAVEVVVPDGVADWAAAKAHELITRLGLRAVEGTSRPVGTELLFGLLNDAVAMRERGYVGAEDLDAAVRLGCGLPQGPLAMLDEIGLDTAVDVLTDLHERTGNPRVRPRPLLTGLVAAGALGRKTGKGFHRYPRKPDGPVAHRVVDGGEHVDIRRLGVVGSGVMANGIVQALVSAGFDVVQVARSAERLTAAREALDWHLERTSPDRPGTWTGGTDHTALADRDLVIEAVAEDLEAKRTVFASLDRVCRPGAVLATTTSGLPVAECAAATSRPGDVLGLHFFNPATTMPLVEVVRTGHTGDAALAVARHVCAKLGKYAVECGDEPGFVVNALLFPYLNEAARAGTATPDRVDAVMRQVHGFPMGPFRLLDVIGADVAQEVIRHLHTAAGADRPAPLLDRAVATGHLGRKSRRGIRDLLALTGRTNS